MGVSSPPFPPLVFPSRLFLFGGVNREARVSAVVLVVEQWVQWSHGHDPKAALSGSSPRGMATSKPGGIGQAQGMGAAVQGRGHGRGREPRARGGEKAVASDSLGWYGRIDGDVAWGALHITPGCRLRSSLCSSLRPTLGLSRRLPGAANAAPARRVRQPETLAASVARKLEGGHPWPPRKRDPYVTSPRSTASADAP